MSTPDQPSDWENLSFEEAMDQLETIVEMLESGDVPLEKAIELFQQGMHLSRFCHNKLKRIEQQVNILLEEDDQAVEEAFHFEEENE